MKDRMSREQWGVCAGCLAAYGSAYLIRLNLSAALPALSKSLSLTPAQSGLLQTVFAVTYAAGQMVNGAVADRVSARKYISAGLALSALFNLLFSFAASYWQTVALWCLNGAAQSMLWTPIVRQISAWFEGEQRRKVSFAISLTLVVGHLGAWAVTGWLTDLAGWRLAFRVPALFAACVAVAVLFINRDRAMQTGRDEKGTVAPLRALLKTGLAAMLLCCVCNGFVRDSVVTWAPTIIRSRSAGLSPAAVTLLIPALNIVGVLFGKLYLTRRKGRIRESIGGMTLVACAVAAALCAAGLRSIMLCAVLLGILCAALYGLHPLFTSLFPMEYDKMGRVALVAGAVDCCIYLGSAMAGALTGGLTQRYGWVVVFGVWAAVLLAGAALAALSAARGRR